MLWGWIVLIVCAAVLTGVVLGIRNNRRQQTVMLNRVRTSSMYSGVHHMLLSCKMECIEEIIIHPDRIEITELPSHKLTYDFRAHRIDPLSPAVLLAMTQAIAVDLPSLQEDRYYTFTRSPRSSRSPWYAYNMRHARKDYMLRAMLEKPSQQE